MNHVRFMVSPELYVVQEALTFDISFYFELSISKLTLPIRPIRSI
jgi:hypothetical protein